MTPTLPTEPSRQSHSLKTSLRLITSLIDTTPPVFYEPRRPVLRSVLSSPAGLRAEGTTFSFKTSTQRDWTTATKTVASPLTIQAPLSFLDVSPKSRTRAVSLALPRVNQSLDRSGMPIGTLEARDKALLSTVSKTTLRPLVKRSNTISPEVGHHNWGSLPPPRPSVPVSPIPDGLAQFTLSPPTGTIIPQEFTCESPKSVTESSPSRSSGIRSALAEPRVSQIEVTSTWSMPMAAVDRVGPRLAKWEDRLAIPKETNLRRSVSMRSGIKDATSAKGSGHKRNHSDSLIKSPSTLRTPLETESLLGKYLAQRPAPSPVVSQNRPTTRRSRTPLPYTMSASPVSETRTDLDRRSVLSRQTSTESLRITLPRRGRSDGVRFISSPDDPTTVAESFSRPLGVWEKAREEAASALANRSRRGSFTSMWQSTRFGGNSEIHTIRSGPDDLDELRARSLKDGYDQQAEGGREVERDNQFMADDEDDEVFIAFEDM